MRVLCYWYALIIPIVIPVFMSLVTTLVCLGLCFCGRGSVGVVDGMDG